MALPPSKVQEPAPLDVDDGHQDHEIRLALALAAADTGVWEFDVGTGRLVWDRRVREVAEVGDDFEPSWSDGFLPALHPDDRERVADGFRTLLAGGLGGRLKLECRIIGRRTGRETWAALEGQCLAAKGGGLRVIGTARDITEQRHAADALVKIQAELERRVSEAIAERQIWADMIEGASEPIAAVDVDMRLIALNGAYRAACERLFQIKLKVGDSLPDAFSHLPLVRDVTISLWRRALAGETVDIPKSQAVGLEGVWYELTMRPLYDRGGRLIGAYQHSRDISARVQDQERLRQAQKALSRAQQMESLGQLTGGVAHDFNNILQVVSGNLHLLADDLAGRPEAQARLGNALAGVARGAKLAAQLLAFGRRQPLEPRVVGVEGFLRGLDDLLQRALGEAIEIETILSPDLWNTQIDRSQLENAVLNLAINARDAMAGRGRLTLEASNETLDEDYCRAHDDLRPGQYVMIAVTDTGCGMDAKTRDRVFEPFFSTKPEGEGTGLGLSMVYGFVKQSEGHIKVYSEVGEGTTVRLYLPRVLAPEEVFTKPTLGPAERGDETILVVEDDPDVRATVVSMLAGLGYRVLEAHDAATALETLDAGEAVDLLFTDVVMPGALRSTDLARLAQARSPDLAVLFTSGYTQNAIVHGGRLDRGVELLSKPYTREALAQKIRQILGAGRGSTPLPAPVAGGSAPASEQAAKDDRDAVAVEPRHRPMRILVVEDDALIRFTTVTMLEDLGHVALEAADGESALEILRAETVDVLVVDRGLPGMSGEAFTRSARAQAAGLPVIFATGDTARSAMAADAVVIHKPYSPEDLRRALDAVAAGNPSGPA
jgi:signal transduction histidine kinase/DNA-binding response OmpR family regulator